jgi:hypothetical protein
VHAAEEVAELLREEGQSSGAPFGGLAPALAFFSHAGAPRPLFVLHLVASRPAKVGDQLILTSFPHTITRGFASVDERNVAVCLLPGTELAFEKEVRCETGMVFSWRLRHTVAKFGPAVAGLACGRSHRANLPIPLRGLRRRFERSETISEHGGKEPQCPQCGSKKDSFVPGRVYVVTSKKS